MKMRRSMETFIGFTLGINPIFAAFSLVYLSITRTREIWPKIKSDKTNVFFWIALALSGLTSIALSINKSVAVGGFFIPFLFIWLYILGRWAIDNPERFLHNILRGIAFLALVAIICKRWNINWSIGTIRVLAKFTVHGRGEILYVADNSLGLLFQAGVVGAAGFLLTKGKNKATILENCVIFLLCSLGLVASGSRGAMMGTFVAIIYLVLQYGLRALIGGLGVMSILLIFGKQRFLSSFQLARHDARIQIWEASLKIIRDHLWFGVGPGNFGQIIDKYKPVTYKGVITCAHSNYFNIIIGWGIIGGIIFWGWQLMIFIRAMIRGITPIQRIVIAILISYYSHVAINDLFTAYAGFLLGLVDHQVFMPKERTKSATTFGG